MWIDIQLLLIVLPLLFLLLFLWHRKTLYWLSWHLPGPFALPFIGNGLSFLDANENLTYIDKLCEVYPSPFRIWIGPKLFVFVHDVCDMETILKSQHCLNKIFIHKFVKEGLGEVDGMFTAEAETWRKHRKLIAPSFGLASIYSHLSIFNKHARSLTQLAAKHINDSEFDIRFPVNVTIIDMFLESSLSSELTTANKSMYAELFNKAQRIIAKRFYQPWLQPQWIWQQTKYPKMIKQIRATSFKLIDEIVHKKKSEGSETLSFIDRLIRISEENPEFTIDNIRAETQTLLAAASDTTSLTTAFFVLMMAIHTNVQDRLYDELKSILAVENMEITRKHIDQMNYTERCIRETLRLFPSGPMLARCTDQDIQLKQYTIPAGTNVICGLRQLMRNSKHWGTDAHTFDPDHFLATNLRDKSAYYFVPFGEGPRNCVGEKYAMIGMKVMIAHLFRSYHFTTHLNMIDLKMRLDINVRLLSKHMVKIHRRN